jgi:hypothetical protein
MGTFAAKLSSIRGNGKFMELKNIFLFVAGSQLQGGYDVVCDFNPERRIKDGNHIEVYECRSSSLTSLQYRRAASRRIRIKNSLLSLSFPFPD